MAASDNKMDRIPDKSIQMSLPSPCLLMPSYLGRQGELLSPRGVGDLPLQMFRFGRFTYTLKKG